MTTTDKDEAIQEFNLFEETEDELEEFQTIDPGLIDELSLATQWNDLESEDSLINESELDGTDTNFLNRLKQELYLYKQNKESNLNNSEAVLNESTK